MAKIQQFTAIRQNNFKNIWYFVLHSTKIITYICITNNSVIKSSF
jgi:hypothetical protein